MIFTALAADAAPHTQRERGLPGRPDALPGSDPGRRERIHRELRRKMSDRFLLFGECAHAL